MTIADGTERIKAALEQLANEHGVQAKRECRLRAGRPHATDVCWHDDRGACLIRFEVDSRREQAEYNLAKPFYPDMAVSRIPAHFISVRFHHAARGLRPVAYLATGVPLPPDLLRAVEVDHKSNSLLDDLRRHLRGILKVVGPIGTDVDDVYHILKPYQLLMCEGRLDLAINALDKTIRLLRAQADNSVQLCLYTIALARLFQQAGWLSNAQGCVNLAHEVGSRAIPAAARDFLGLIEWKVRVASQGADWGHRADLLKEAECSVGSLRGSFIWRQALAHRRIGRTSVATEHLKRYQDHRTSGTQSQRRSVSSFFAAQEQFLAGDWNTALTQASLLADVEMEMWDTASEEPSASLSAIIAAEALRAIILSSARAEGCAQAAKQLLRQLLAQGREFGIGVHAESLSDIALDWPRELVDQSAATECSMPGRMSLMKLTLSDQLDRLRAVHWKLKQLEQRC